MLKNQLVDSWCNHLQIKHCDSLNKKQKLSNKIIGTVVNKYKAFNTSDRQSRRTNLGVLEVNGDNLFVKNKSL